MSETCAGTCAFPLSWNKKQIFYGRIHESNHIFPPEANSPSLLSINHPNQFHQSRTCSHNVLQLQHVTSNNILKLCSLLISLAVCTTKVSDNCAAQCTELSCNLCPFSLKAKIQWKKMKLLYVNMLTSLIRKCNQHLKEHTALQKVQVLSQRLVLMWREYRKKVQVGITDVFMWWCI